jgi:hypothetical protein
MIDFSVLLASMSSGFMGGLFRISGTIPMSILCMLVMYTQGIRPGLRSYLSIAAGQAVFLLFFLTAPYTLIEFWYLLEPAFMFLGVYCIGKMLQPYMNIILFIFPQYYVMDQDEKRSPEGLRILQLTLPYPRYFFIATLCGTAEFGGSLFQTQAFNFTALHLYPIAYILPYVLVGLVLNTLVGFGITTFLRKIYVNAIAEEFGISAVIYAIIVTQSLVIGTYTYGLYFNLPLQAVGVPEELVAFHVRDDLGIRDTEEEPELLVWFGPDLLPEDKENDVNEKREQSFMDEDVYLYDEQYRSVLFRLWEKSPLTWMTRAINLKRMDFCTPTNLADTLRRSTPLVAKFGPTEGTQSVGFAWHEWYWTPERPGEPTYDRPVRLIDTTKTNLAENRFVQDVYEARVLRENFHLRRLHNRILEKTQGEMKSDYVHDKNEIFDVFVDTARERLLALKGIRTKKPVSLQSLSTKQRESLDKFALQYGTLAWQMYSIGAYTGPGGESLQFDLGHFYTPSKLRPDEAPTYADTYTDGGHGGMDILTQSILHTALNELAEKETQYNQTQYNEDLDTLYPDLAPISSISATRKKFMPEQFNFAHSGDMQTPDTLWEEHVSLEVSEQEGAQQELFQEQEIHPLLPDTKKEGDIGFIPMPPELSLLLAPNRSREMDDEDKIPFPFVYPDEFRIPFVYPTQDMTKADAEANEDIRNKAMEDLIHYHFGNHTPLTLYHTKQAKLAAEKVGESGTSKKDELRKEAHRIAQPK